MKDNLLPCPFCGEQVVLDFNALDESNSDIWFIGHINDADNCILADTYTYSNRSVCIRMWNTRAKIKKDK